MKYIIILILLILIVISGYSQPRNLQVKVIGVLKKEGRKMDLKALSLQGDTVYIKYGFWKATSTGKIKVGTWLTIYSDYSHKYCEWYCRKILINQ